jgi:hypothetical protein
MIGFGIVIFPFSWKLDFWGREKKSILSFGPIRFVLYKKPGEWKPKPFDARDDMEAPGMM